jgi:hypothetical protein
MEAATGHTLRLVAFGLSPCFGEADKRIVKGPDREASIGET